MKKLNYLLLGLAGLTLASCSQDDILDSPMGNGNYNVTVKLPADLGTRAANMNTGLTANNLSYAVYDAQGVLVDTGNKTFSDDATGALSTTVSLNLATGQSYNISFFAQAPGSEDVYVFSPENKTMTVNYDAMTNAGLEQDDLYDCFINKLSTGVVGEDVTNTSILLNRPVAQINWGTNDYTQTSVKNYYGSSLQYLESKLVATAYTTFDLLENDVDKDQTTSLAVDFENVDGFTIPLNASSKPAAFPVGGYNYIAMQYVLAPQAEDLIDLKLDIDNQATATPANTFEGKITNEINVANAPIQANFRTNIYGALLTDQVDITVTKNQNWGGGYNLPQGDLGEMIYEGLYFNESIKTYTITSTDGLENYATKIAIYPANGTNQQLSGFTVLLDKDLDMNGVEHTPFNNAGAIFDGQGHTISNLTVAIKEGNASAGFMSSAIGTVQNINFENANISGNFKVGVLAGDGLCAKISNISVNKAVITSTPWITAKNVYDDGNNCGGIVGYLSGEPNASVTNCSVNELTATAYRKVGGIVGFANQGNSNQSTVVENNTVSNSTITANQQLPTTTPGYDGAPRDFEAGEICGGWSNIATVMNNYADDVSVTTINSEGVQISNVSSSEALQNVVGKAENGATINVAAGTYTFPAPSEFKADNLVINCEEGVVFTGNNNWQVYSGGKYGIRGASINNATFSNPSGTAVNGYVGGNFNNCTFEGRNAFSGGYITASEVNFNKCKFIGNGTYAVHIDSPAAVTNPNVNFTNCEFNGFVAVGAKITYKFDGCTFSVNSNSNFGGGNFYGDDYFTNCFFNVPSWDGDSNTFRWIDLNQIGVIYDFTNCTIPGGAKLTSTNYKFRTTKNGVTATIDGVSYNLPNNAN